MADAACMRRVAAIVSAEVDAGRGEIAVVVSAMAKVTDALFSACERAAARDEAAVEATLASLWARHDAVIAELLPAAVGTTVRARIQADLDDVRRLLSALRVLGARPEALEEVVVGHGEVWSAQILAAHLGFDYLDARTTLVVAGDGPPGETPEVDMAESRRRLDAFVAAHPRRRMVVTGYVATTSQGAPTTLKRNGSDFSAALFGALLDAAAITIWTDVDGVYSADPRRVPEAVLLHEMSYREAMELAYFGAKVVHPRTMQPAVAQGIPLWIRNTFRPTVAGTLIHEAPRGDGPLVKGFSTVDDVALLNVEGAGMVGIPGVAERLFGALRRVGVSAIVISQASSEHSISVAVKKDSAARARRAVEEAFALELSSGALSRIDVDDSCSIVAAVGDAMALRPGVAARFFDALADVGVNVRAVAQGSSERNITAVVPRAQASRALRAVHARFTLSNLTLSVGVVGKGLIAQALMAQLEAQRDALRQRFHVDVRVRAVCDSKRMALGEDGALSLGLLQAADTSVPLDHEALARHVRSEHLPHAVLIDCTASDDVADRYPGWMQQGIHVITPNKRAASGPWPRYAALQAAQRAGHALFLGEATVGAGLPIMTTLKDLQLTGDTVTAVRGVLSGTLSYIFNSLSDEVTFSAAVREAQRLGYTEPDAREDLSGTDFARKLVVLARAMGRTLSLDDVQVEDLAPGLPFGAPAAELLQALSARDDAMNQRRRDAALAGQVLRYVGELPEAGPARVSLQALPLDHPFAGLRGTDNVVAFTTRRYATAPLVVRGPGAGPEVPAGGVFGDLLRLAAHLGARL